MDTRITSGGGKFTDRNNSSTNLGPNQVRKQSPRPRKLRAAEPSNGGSEGIQLRILLRPRPKGFWVGQAFGQRLRRDITKKTSEPRPRRFWGRRAFKQRLRREITKRPA